MDKFELFFANAGKTIEAGELKKIVEMQDSRLQIVDLRDKEDYDRGHIPGAISMPLDNEEAEWRSMVDKLLDRQKVTVVSCYFGSRSVDARNILKSMDYNPIHILEDGMFTWRFKLEK